MKSQKACQISNREGPDQTTSTEVDWAGSVLFVYVFFADN